MGEPYDSMTRPERLRGASAALWEALNHANDAALLWLEKEPEGVRVAETVRHIGDAREMVRRALEKKGGG